MKVMRLGTGKEGQMVAGMCTQCVHYGQREPEPSCCDVTAHYEDSQERWHEIAKDVLHRVAINGRYSDWGNNKRSLKIVLIRLNYSSYSVQSIRGAACECACRLLCGAAGGGNNKIRSPRSQ